MTASSASDPPAGAAPIPWKLLLLVCGVRIIIGLVLCGWELAQPTPAQQDVRYYHGIDPQLSVPAQLFVKWDSYWYLKIADSGYAAPSADMPQSNLAFAPLYPLAIRILHKSGLEPWVCGVLLSLVCYLIFNVYLFKLGCVLESPTLGRHLIWFVSAFPSAWVLHMVYTEALFCMIIAAFFTCYLRGDYWKAGLWGMWLPLTRVAGVVLVPVLLIQMLVDALRGRDWWQPLRCLLGAVLGAVALMVYYQYITGDPLAFAAAGRAWFEKVGVAGRDLPLFFSFADRLLKTPIAWLPLALFLAYGCASVCLLYRDKDIRGVFAVLYMMMLFKAPLITAQLRYLVPLVPVHAYVTARFANQRLFVVLIVLMLIAQLIVARFYLTWQMVM